jgi:protein-disulfide isomerase
VHLAGSVAARRALPAILLALGFPLLAAGSCKKGEPPEASRPTELPKLVDDPAPADRKPVTGAKLDGVKPDDVKRFEALADQLPSPCGKAHSLRTSRNTDEACLRAPFAVDYVTTLLQEGASDEELKALYVARYPSERKVEKFELGATRPHIGPEDARVVFVEYFDFGCPMCGEFAPILKEVQAAYPRDVVIYYRQFPLPGHPNSDIAAQAAIAAGKQGKYKEMHELLFSDQHAHAQSDLDGYAAKLGLDMKKFAADFKAAEAGVAADKAEGIAAGVQGTPTIFINGVKWEGPPAAKYVKLWVDEELALNR